MSIPDQRWTVHFTSLQKAENKFTATSGLPACVCALVCVCVCLCVLVCVCVPGLLHAWPTLTRGRCGRLRRARRCCWTTSGGGSWARHTALSHNSPTDTCT